MKGDIRMRNFFQLCRLFQILRSAGEKPNPQNIPRRIFQDHGDEVGGVMSETPHMP